MWLAQHYGPKCSPKTTMVMLNSGVSRGFDHRTAEGWKAFAEILVAFGYHVRSADTGVYNCRNTASGYPSPHSWATALDLNWQTNPATGGPYGGPNKVVTDMPAEMVAAIKAIRTKGGVRVFGWGGDYSSFKDAMHFEVIATPEELARGIDWSTVKAALRDPKDPATWPALEHGDSGPTVQHLQFLLIEAGYHMGDAGADGDFGEITEGAVRQYQADRGLTVDGIVGLQTWTALLNGLAKLEAEDAGPVKDQPKAPDYAVGVIYGQGALPDQVVANHFALGFPYRAAPHTTEATFGTAYLIGGPAVRGFNREQAQEIIEVAGATRAETWAKLSDLIAQRITDL